MTFEEMEKAVGLMFQNQQLMDKNLSHLSEMMNQQVKINEQIAKQIAQLEKYIRHLKNGGEQGPNGGTP